MKTTVLINGKKNQNISISNRAVQFGDAVFETCVVRDNKLLFWSYHFDRLEKGRNRLHINSVEEELWLQDFNKAISIAKVNNCTLKLILARGESVKGYGFDADIKPVRIVIISSPAKALAKYYSLSVCDSGYIGHSLLAGIKHCNRLEQILARVNISTDEGIMLDKDNNVISVTQGNIFAIKGDLLITPDLFNCGIEGTRRRAILELAPDLDLQVKITNVSLDYLFAADEVFITSSGINVMSINKINNHIFRKRSITNKIRKCIDSSNEYITLKPKIKKIKLYVIAIILALFFSVWLEVKNITLQESIIYNVPHNTTLKFNANKLKHFGHIKSSYYMIFLAKLFNLDNKLKSGYYKLTPNMSILNMLDMFATAKVATINVTLVEGQTIKSYYQQLSTNKSLKSNYDFAGTMNLVGINAPYEGKFWADTYKVDYGDNVVNVLSRANNIMRKKLTELWENRQENLPLETPYDAIILASLIEKESANKAEKQQIAGVFVKRLQKNMRLQTDPSIIYALGGDYKKSLSRKDLKIDSPYNTYRYKGLPPGAIASVSYSSLYAALHPATSDELYFMLKKDGTHAFSVDYEEHKKHVKKYFEK